MPCSCMGSGIRMTFRCSCLLLSVNGIGPKAALGVLSGLSADELRFAVLSDDVKTLSRAPGIGKKTAQKLILELKDKLKLEDAFEKKLMHEQENADLNDTDFHDGRQEAVEALTALGYSSSEALKAVHKVTDVDPGDVEANPESSPEAAIMAGLQQYTMERCIDGKKK